MNSIRHLSPKVRTLSMAILSLFFAVASSSTGFALDLDISSGVDAAKGADQPSDLFGSSGIFSTITNVLLFILGAVSVIMIIIGGLRYVISGGDSNAVTAAKNTILYAIVGVVVAILAYAIISFVINSFVPAGTNNSTGV